MVETPLLNATQNFKLARNRSALAAGRAAEARTHFKACYLCSHRCGVNRLEGHQGPCHAGPIGRVFHSQIEVGDEATLAPVFALAFSGCDLRCDFCNTGRQSWDATAGESPDLRSSGALMGRLQRAAVAGTVRSVMILGGEPTIHLPSALQLVACIPENLPVVWKTNGHGTAESNALLDGVFDTWVVDLKFGNNDCAQRIARVTDYTETLHANLRWAASRTRLIIRHLLMPGHLDCCWRPVATWIAANLPGIEVSLRSGFWPGWFSSRHPELRRTGSIGEERDARQIGINLGLHLIP